MAPFRRKETIRRRPHQYRRRCWTVQIRRRNDSSRNTIWMFRARQATTEMP